MKKLLSLAVMTTMALFSVAAIAHVITSNSLEQAKYSLEQAETVYFYFKWLLFGLGLLCFIALRREYHTV